MPISGGAIPNRLSHALPLLFVAGVAVVVEVFPS
jgi:hypothetical protein